MSERKSKTDARTRGESIIRQSEERQVGDKTFVRVPGPVEAIVVKPLPEPAAR
ncbi:hypothetical protein JNUCC0626_09985 [Lentzea sp. JNUCC 0626]|uniref:hypothetical protein n=1 Tax=Lentzea sp. JNUCC 0626 TaxID=3367513 RepID=UPI0037479CA1